MQMTERYAQHIIERLLGYRVCISHHAVQVPHSRQACFNQSRHGVGIRTSSRTLSSWHRVRHASSRQLLTICELSPWLPTWCQVQHAYEQIQGSNRLDSTTAKLLACFHRWLLCWSSGSWKCLSLRCRGRRPKSRQLFGLTAALERARAGKARKRSVVFAAHGLPTFKPRPCSGAQAGQVSQDYRA